MTPISEQQQELLSAALDGQLSAAEQAQLDQQLEHDPGLAAEFAELRSMQALLQELPPVRPPRSFTLDPAIHAPKRRFWLSGWTRWVGVVGAFVLMLTVGLQLTNQSEQAMTMAPVAEVANNNPTSASRMMTEANNLDPMAPPMGNGGGMADPNQPTPAAAEDMALMGQTIEPMTGAAPSMLMGYPTPMTYSAPITPDDELASTRIEQATALAGTSLNDPLIEQNDPSSPDTLDLEQPEFKGQPENPASIAPVAEPVAKAESSLLLWFSLALVLGVSLAAGLVYWFKLHKQA